MHIYDKQISSISIDWTGFICMIIIVLIYYEYYKFQVNVPQRNSS